MKLKSEETILTGSWIFDGPSMKSDDVTKRIEWLISKCLNEIAVDKTGWNKLYQDMGDKRYWELTYPKSEQHGGGAPQLKKISAQEANAKYNI